MCFYLDVGTEEKDVPCFHDCTEPCPDGSLPKELKGRNYYDELVESNSLPMQN